MKEVCNFKKRLRDIVYLNMIVIFKGNVVQKF